MTIASDLLNACQDSLGSGLPVLEDIRRYNGVCIDSSRFGNCNVVIPYDIFQFSDKSELIISGYHVKRAAARS